MKAVVGIDWVNFLCIKGYGFLRITKNFTPILAQNSISITLISSPMYSHQTPLNPLAHLGLVMA